ncbi:hypothetical protein PPERSA_09318 [Pseudocohnilembus persalinus]|uniref:Transmembrane protein n=1 Tax=Pseudocohnilembus persalinus TaxID=266149 RepID=A0A0V0R5M9_PSEPJ|nr:hypothetical protein PPERSA_09318 [Pseudocohnilembus persalinus]|eukprot:KRX09648.1 hypothetical protein PPERSA_09318 [Pseudocohnilembus persalinus]
MVEISIDLPQLEALKKIFLDKIRSFAKDHNFKGLVGFLTVFIIIPSLTWFLMFNSYLDGDDFDKKSYQTNECQDLKYWGYLSWLMYFIALISALVLIFWAYLIMVWNRNDEIEDLMRNTNQQQYNINNNSYKKKADQLFKQAKSSAFFQKTEWIFGYAVAYYPALYYTIVLVLFLGLAWNLGDVKLNKCQPLRSFILVYIVLHWIFFGGIILTLCCGLVGAGTYLNSYGLDGIMPQSLEDQEKQFDPVNNQNHFSRLSSAFYDKIDEQNNLNIDCEQEDLLVVDEDEENNQNNKLNCENSNLIDLNQQVQEKKSVRDQIDPDQL